jgi:hypothetical protein
VKSKLLQNGIQRACSGGFAFVPLASLPALTITRAAKAEIVAGAADPSSAGVPAGILRPRGQIRQDSWTERELSYVAVIYLVGLLVRIARGQIKLVRAGRDASGT